MADQVFVSTVYNAMGLPVSTEATFSDSRNHRFTVIGLPNGRYNLDEIANEVFGVTVGGGVAATDDGGFSSGTGTLIQTNVPDPSALESVTFTDSGNSNTLTIMGVPGAVYDLELLKYLLAVVSAQETFMQMQFGDDYAAVKNEFLQRAGLV
jgi:hypothetical protein